MEPKNIRILYLAHYAPATLDAPIPVGIKDLVYAKYHFKVFQTLKSTFPLAVSSSDPSIMLSKELFVDYIFSLYNRMPFRNSEVFISSVAEYHNIPYLGARPNIRALAEDKHLAKMMAKYAGVETPDWKTYDVGTALKEPPFEPPYFCKPRFGAASVGIDPSSACASWSSAQNKIRELHTLGMDVIVERQIKGVYHTSPVLNNFGAYMYLPCIAQHSDLEGGIVTYEQKRKIAPGLTREIVEDKSLQSQLQEASKKMFPLLQPLDYTRFDYIVENCSGTPYFLEFNVCCNLGEHSTVSQAAKHLGIGYEELIGNITYSSLYRSGLLDDTFGKQF